MEAVDGVIAIDTKLGAMVRPKDPLTPEIVATTEQAPLAFAESTPLADTLPTAELDELQAAELVRSLVVPSL